MSLRIKISTPENEFYHEVRGTSVRIGRSTTCDLSIPCEDLSREHCRFEVRQNNFYLVDLESKNGVTVNGTKIPAHTLTLVTEKSEIYLSNVYSLKIDQVSPETRLDIHVEDNPPDHHIDTRTILSESSAKKDKTNVIRKNLTLYVAAGIVLAVFLYQAFGV